MTERQSVAVRDTDGNLLWFPVAEAERWPPTTLDAGDLYRIGGRWIMRPWVSDVTGEPAQIVDNDKALEWFVSNGYAIPEALADCADRVRMR